MVSGYWHPLITLAGYCRACSYLLSIRGHDILAIHVVDAVFTGNPWLPTPATV